MVFGNLLGTHDQASLAVGWGAGLKNFCCGWIYKLTGKKVKLPNAQNSSDEESSTTTWSSNSDKDVKKRLLLKRRSWGKLDNLEDGAQSKETQLALKRISRFLTGIALSQGFYLLLTYHSKWDPTYAAWITGAIGFCVAIGMAFSLSVRTVVALLLPSFCTGKGRSIIMAFCLMLLLDGPIVNVSQNYKMISKGLVCGDELGYNMSQGLNALIHEGQNKILASMSDTVEAVMEAVEKGEENYQKYARLLESIKGVVKKLNNFIFNIGDICSSRLGSVFCIIPNFVAKQAKAIITDPVNNAIDEIKYEFAFNMSFDHEFKYNVNSTKSASDVSQAIIKELESTVSGITDVFEWMRFGMAFSTIFVVLKAIKYRLSYLSKNEFDNFYITEKFVKVDKRRKRKGKPFVLPLRNRENSFYVKPSKIWMSRPELKKFCKGFAFVSFNFFYTLAVFFIDYSLWWLIHKLGTSLSLRRQAGGVTESLIHDKVSQLTEDWDISAKDREFMDKMVSLSVDGIGWVSMIYQAIATSLDRLADTEGYEFNIDKCLPVPRHPDYPTYILLLSLYIALFILCFVEAYVLRMRRVIMSKYYPRRERVRVLFLRAKILSKRGIGTDAKVNDALQSACIDVQKSKEEEKYKFFSRFANQGGFIGKCARILSHKNKYQCLVCKLAGGVGHGKLFIRCSTYGCNAIYCVECFEDIHRICAVCMIRQKKTKKRKRTLDSSSGKNKQSAINEAMAESIFDSSGISDSSAGFTSSDDDSAMEIVPANSVSTTKVEKDGSRSTYVALRNDGSDSAEEYGSSSQESSSLLVSKSRRQNPGP